MKTFTSASNSSSSLGRLRVGGDWAQAHGDFEALRYVAQQLATCVGEPLHCELMKLAELCLCDPDAAGGLWARLKIELQG